MPWREKRENEVFMKLKTDPKICKRQITLKRKLWKNKKEIKVENFIKQISVEAKKIYCIANQKRNIELSFLK